MLPFIGIGAHKAGSGWLHKFLSSYEECSLPSAKEIHYFDFQYCDPDIRPNGAYKGRLDRLLDLAEKIYANGIHDLSMGQWKPRGIAALNEVNSLLSISNDATYKRYMDSLCKRDLVKVYGEITPTYSIISDRGFRAIDRVLPGAKIIFIMRDPVDRFWSQLRFSHDLLGLNGKAQRDPNARIVPSLSNRKSVINGDYQRTITKLERVFSEDRIHYIFFEDLFSKEGGIAEVRKLETFLELTKKTQEEIQIALSLPDKSSSQFTLLDESRRLITNHYGYVYDFVRQKFGRIPNRWDLSLSC